MTTVRYFCHSFIDRGTTFMYLQYNGTPLFITFLLMFGSHHKPSARPYLMMLRIDRPIARISSFLVLYFVPRMVVSLCRRDHNCMDSYRVSTVDVPESPIASGPRGLWQQGCDSLHCHEECWVLYHQLSSFSPESMQFHAVKFSSPKWKNHCEGPGTTREMNLSLL